MKTAEQTVTEYVEKLKQKLREGHRVIMSGEEIADIEVVRTLRTVRVHVVLKNGTEMLLPYYNFMSRQFEVE